jgi:hypothetical protein
MPVWPLPTWRHCTAGSRLPPDHACDVADPRALAFRRRCPASLRMENVEVGLMPSVCSSLTGSPRQFVPRPDRVVLGARLSDEIVR